MTEGQWHFITDYAVEVSDRDAGVVIRSFMCYDLKDAEAYFDHWIDRPESGKVTLSEQKRNAETHARPYRRPDVTVLREWEYKTK